ncbi:hypothetical protein OAK81_01330 [Verrucomicrobiales bacterium]|nr:hypothetical protein [Verrucomicrobiales bacterium]MDC0291914.1 hypothetical protein [Verrucomicrobiales bacterium]MDC0322122.1 hypothetical protein [Verrucomicrobiales bacterium]
MRRWFILLVVFLAVQQVGFSRIFTNLQGKKINGEIQSVSGDRVEMKVATKRFIFPIAMLVEVDQTFIKK